MRLEFAGPSTSDRQNASADPARLVNCYRRPAGDGATIVPVLGMAAPLGFAIDAEAGADTIRAMLEFEGTNYAVTQGWLWTFSTSGTTALEPFGAISGGLDDAPVTMAGNNGDIGVVVGGRYFVWNGTTMVEPATGAFSSFGSVDFLGQCTLLTQRGGRRVQWSALADATTLPALNFATTESRDDVNIRGMTFGSEYWVFKEKSIERWYQDDTGGFKAIPGSTIDKGLLRFELVCRGDSGGMFIATDGKAYLVAPGGVMQPISNQGLQSAITRSFPRTCFYYQDDGHEFYVITFRARPSWVYDLTTGEWHERAEGVNDPWRARFAIRGDAGFWVGRIDGKVALLNRGEMDDFPAIADYDENGNPTALIRRIISRNLAFDGFRRKIAKITIPMRTGFSDLTTEPIEAQLIVSPDRGATWGAPKVRTFGLGDYGRQMTWRSLGQFRNFTMELRMTDNAYVPVDAFAFVEVA